MIAIVDRALVLDQLNIALGTAPKVWRGVEASKGEFSRFDGSWSYDALALPVPYSGGIVVGGDFLREFYVHMGFHRAHCYRTVLELYLADGRLVRIADHSATMQEIRERIRQHEASTSPPERRPSREEIEHFVNDAFSLSYEKKWRY